MAFRSAALLAGLLLAASAAVAEETIDPSLAHEVEQYLALAGPEAPDTSLQWTWKDGPRASTSDGAFEVRLGGQAFVDSFWASSDDYPSSVTEDSVFFRTVRLAVSGHAYTNVVFKVQLDFAKDPVELKDVFFGLRNLGAGGWGTLIVGQEKEPFGLDVLVSSKYTTFLEISAPASAFAPSRNVGISLAAVLLEKRVLVKAGLYRDTDEQGSVMEDGSQAFTLRIVANWWVEEETSRRVHTGFGFSFRDPNEETYRFRARPGLGKGDRLVDTGTIAADEVLLFNAELAATWKSFHAVLEFYYADVSAPTGGADASFTGWYVEVGWFVTGESRPYKDFVWSRVRPRRNFHDGDGGWGAWQLVFRFDDLDLTDAGIVGGEQRTFTFGVNWHWNPNTRVMFHFVYADVTTGSVPAGTGPGEIRIFETRFQFDF